MSLDYNPVKYVFLNKGLHMSVGKAAAQTAHAVAMSLIQQDNDLLKAKWVASPHRTVIVLEARDEAHMRSIRDYLQERNVQFSWIVDEGVNEIDPHTVTALATHIMNKNDDTTDAIMSTFKLYRDVAKFKVEFER